jgi:hypothetical protein
MHAGNRDAVFQPHQFGQHLGALNHRNMQPASFGNFGIIDGDGGTRDHDIRAGDVGGACPSKMTAPKRPAAR